MRNLTDQEMLEVSGGGLSVGDIVVGSGNCVLSGNSVDVCNVLNGNSIANDALNGSLNGTGALNYSLNH